MDRCRTPPGFAPKGEREIVGAKLPRLNFACRAPPAEAKGRCAAELPANTRKFSKVFWFEREANYDAEERFNAGLVPRSRGTRPYVVSIIYFSEEESPDARVLLHPRYDRIDERVIGQIRRPGGQQLPPSSYPRVHREKDGNYSDQSQSIVPLDIEPCLVNSIYEIATQRLPERNAKATANGDERRARRGANSERSSRGVRSTYAGQEDSVRGAYSYIAFTGTAIQERFADA